MESEHSSFTNDASELYFSEFHGSVACSSLDPPGRFVLGNSSVNLESFCLNPDWWRRCICHHWSCVRLNVEVSYFFNEIFGLSLYLDYFLMNTGLGIEIFHFRWARNVLFLCLKFNNWLLVLGVEPLLIWVGPAIIIIVKHSWSKLWMHWWHLLLLLLLLIACTPMTFIARLTLIIVILLVHHRLSFDPGSLEFFLVLIEHHFSLLFQCEHHIFLLSGVLILHG